MLKGKLVKAVFGVASVIVISRLLGFIREMVIADKFGTSVDYDLYLIAVMLPGLAYGVINFSVVYLFVPYLSKKKSKSETTLLWSDIMPSFNLIISSALAVAFLIIVTAPYFLKFWAEGYSPEEYSQIVLYARLLAFMLLLGTTEAFMRSYLNVNKIFTYPAAGYIVYNIFCISAVLLFFKQLSGGVLVLGLLGGLTAQNIYLFLKIIPTSPFKQFKLSFKNEDTTAIFATGSFIILIEIINRSYLLFDRFVATQFGEGIISALNYSQVLVLLPDSVIGFAIGAVIFPYLSDASQSGAGASFGRVYQKTITSALLIAVPIAAFFFVETVDLISVIFKRGEFDERSVEITSSVLRLYTPSIATLFVMSTSIRAVYSAGWVKPLFGFALIALGVKVAGNFLLPQIIDYPGILLSTSISHILFASLMFAMIVRKVPLPNKSELFSNITKLISIAVLIAVVFTYVSPVFKEWIPGETRLDAIFRLMISGFSMVAFYAFMLYILGMKNKIIGLVRERTDG